jgi:drug/metabolite transporter (DMT)-like permease
MTDSKLSTSRLIQIYASLTVLAVIWGNAFVAIRHSVQFMTPIELAAARFLPVLILFGGWLLIKDRSGLWQLLREDGLKVAYMALAGVTVYHLALNTGETRVPAGTASLIIALSPAVAALLSAIFLHERITFLKVGGFAVSFAGLAIIVTAGEGVRFDPRDLGYYLLVLLSACVWGSYGVVGQSVLQKHPQMRVTAATLSIAAVPMVALAPVDFWGRLTALPSSVWWAVAFLSLLCTILAYLIWLNGVRYLGAARVQSFNYVVPLFATLSGVVLLGERITLGQVIGGILIVAGVIAMNQR